MWEVSRLLAGYKFKLETNHKLFLYRHPSITTCESATIQTLMRFDFLLCARKNVEHYKHVMQKPVTEMEESNLSTVTNEYVYAIVNKLPASEGLSENNKTKIRHANSLKFIVWIRKQSGKAFKFKVILPHQCQMVILTSMRAEIWRFKPDIKEWQSADRQ